MGKYQKCNCCGHTASTCSGHMLKHIKQHGFNTIDEYYYSFNTKDLCCVCNKENKSITNWNFEKKLTCSNKECKKKYHSLVTSNYQKTLALENRHNYQSKIIQDKLRLITKEKIANGTHHSLTPENKEKQRQRITQRNKEFGNPMQNKEVAARMANTSRGKILSTQHKQSISLGMKEFLAGLSIEDFTKRMKNTENIISSSEERQYENIEISHIFENDYVYVNRTKEYIKTGTDFIKEFLVLNEEDLGIA